MNANRFDLGRIGMVGRDGLGWMGWDGWMDYRINLLGLYGLMVGKGKLHITDWNCEHVIKRRQLDIGRVIDAITFTQVDFINKRHRRCW